MPHESVTMHNILPLFAFIESEMIHSLFVCLGKKTIGGFAFSFALCRLWFQCTVFGLAAYRAQIQNVTLQFYHSLLLLYRNRASSVKIRLAFTGCA